MNAETVLMGIAKALAECGLEAVLIGNAAAALQGAPVTTLDFDFMSVVHGVTSFASLRSGATKVFFGQHPLLVANLRDIIRSKKAAGRARDRAVLEIVQRTLREKEK